MEQLHPDLQEHMREDKVIGWMIHMPYCVQVCLPPLEEMESREGQAILKHINRVYANKIERKNAYIRCGDISSYLFMVVERPYRMDAFLKHHALGLRDPDLFRSVWIDSEDPCRMLEKIKAVWDDYSDAFRDTLDSLPEEMTIYRGVKEKNDRGMSWTLSRDKASWFANRYRSSGYIKKRRIRKDDVIAYFKDRGEEEIIYMGE